MEQIIIDVREIDEYVRFHIPNSINIPLSCFREVAPNTLSHLKDRCFVLMCGGGVRAQKCADLLELMDEANFQNYKVYEGGIKEWIKQGKDIHFGKALPVVSYLNIIVGLLVLTSIALSHIFSNIYLVIAIGVSLILIKASIKKMFPLYYLIMKAPWNKGKYLKV